MTGLLSVREALITLRQGAGGRAMPSCATEGNRCEASARIDNAEVIMKRACEHAMAVARSGAEPKHEDKVRYRRDAFYRFNQSLQHFFDSSAKIDTQFAVGAKS